MYDLAINRVDARAVETVSQPDVVERGTVALSEKQEKQKAHLLRSPCNSPSANLTAWHVPTLIHSQAYNVFGCGSVDASV